MRRRAALVPLALLALAIASLDAARPDPSPRVTPTSQAPAGVSWTLPTNWRAVGPRLTRLGEPAQSLAAATFPLRQPKPDANCSPVTAHEQLPAHGALVFLLESRDWEGRRPKLAPRPAHFRLPRARSHECFGHARVITWGEADRALTAVVLLGPRAGERRRRQVRALLDSLVVPVASPPPPPAGWRTAISGNDSLRVPPGWSSYALRRQRGSGRPRLLFVVANERVTLRVTEHRRGPASRRFPRPRRPLAFDARRRAGIGFRGYRISLRIYVRPRATQRDLEWAMLSARSLGVSSVGRG